MKFVKRNKDSRTGENVALIDGIKKVPKTLYNIRKGLNKWIQSKYIKWWKQTNFKSLDELNCTLFVAWRISGFREINCVHTKLCFS